MNIKSQSKTHVVVVGWPVLMAFVALLLHGVAQHYDCVDLFLHDHRPEVVSRVGKRALRADEAAFS